MAIDVRLALRTHDDARRCLQDLASDLKTWRRGHRDAASLIATTRRPETDEPQSSGICTPRLADKLARDPHGRRFDRERLWLRLWLRAVVPGAG